MATLLTNAKLGNTGVSSLLKSATSLANELNTFKDAQAAQDYSLSVKSGDDLATYQNYLQGRINLLNTTGSITDATKAISLTNSLYSAIKANGSADIQRENIQIMSGNATLTDKYNAIVGQYTRAVGIGDMSLAQSLESQAYSVNQSIQYQGQAAASARTALSRAAGGNGSQTGPQVAGGQEHVATNLNFALKQLNDDIQNGGQKQFNSVIQKWVATNAGALKALGVVLPKGAQPNYFDIANGVAGAIYNAHMLAYQAELPTNPDVAQGYYNAAISLATGDTKLSTLAGSRTVQEIQQASANPAQYAYDGTTGTLKQTQQTGFQVGQNGKISPTFSGSIVQVATPQLTAQLAKLGLQYNGTANNGQEVQATQNTPQWLRNILGPNGITNIYVGQNGVLQFQGDSANGKAVYTIAKDSKGLDGLFQQDANGSTHIGGDYGFNPQVNAVTDPKGFQIIQNMGMTGQAGRASAIYLHNNPQGLINSGQQIQAQIALANQTAARAMLALAPPPLPKISVPPVTAPKQSISIAPANSPQTQAIVPQTVSVQSPTVNPQQPAGISLQGGSFQLQ